MRAAKGLYRAGTALSALVGVWHFFVPAMFAWGSYIEYDNLLTGINWTNFCFSLLLAGLSALLFALAPRVFAGDKTARLFFGLLVLVWFARVVLAIVDPWPLEPVAAAAYGQFALAVLVFGLLLAAFLLLISRKGKPS